MNFYKISMVVWTDEHQWLMIYDIFAPHLSESLCMLLLFCSVISDSVTFRLCAKIDI